MLDDSDGSDLTFSFSDLKDLKRESCLVLPKEVRRTSNYNLSILHAYRGSHFHLHLKMFINLDMGL